MRTWDSGFVPPFCPNPECRHHGAPEGWRMQCFGFFERKAWPHRIRRFRCLTCRRCFSTQTFDTTYWLKRPDVQAPILRGLVACSGFRQLGRTHGVAGTTVQRQAERLGRHCLLFQRRHAPPRPHAEPVVLDGLVSFEFSQYWPCELNLLVGRSHFLYGFTDSELRRTGRMRPAQKRRRAELEQRHGRPEPRATEEAVAELMRQALPQDALELHLYSDEHAAYPRALKRFPHWRIHHHTTSSKAARTPANPLFPANLADALVRHSSANHKRETIAFSKRRQSAVERLAVFQVWRNFMKRTSEARPRDSLSPAQRLGFTDRLLEVGDVLHRRLFPSLVRLTGRLRDYYRRRIRTRQAPACRPHALLYAF